jgi:hypothetical protein
VTDFLARLAARAVGGQPVARPRLPALFEELDRTGESLAGLELVESEVLVLAPAVTRAAETAPTGVIDPPGRPEAEAERPRVSRDQLPPRPVPRAAPAAQRPAAEPAPGASETRAGPAEAGRTDSGEPRTTTDGVREIVRTGRTPRAAAVPAVQRAAAASPVGAVRASRRAADSPGASIPGPPTVRVHIGRLEVRANLQAAPAPPPPRQREQEQALPLGEYLRGKRGAT